MHAVFQRDLVPIYSPSTHGAENNEVDTIDKCLLDGLFVAFPSAVKSLDPFL